MGDGGDEDTGLPLDLGSFDKSIVVTASSRFSAASIFVMPVVEVDGKPVGTGKPGPVATRLREIYLDEMRKAAI